eukprot:TRINITY_DN6352_c0_g1_i2.p1 TRINITY_DN6352_c0_g1~~TRINITY_DN6352_c0_g1_i2.p1  ORF type:complete len:805 (+),score=195.49 TRINITY_DN6352_c0_g1_i2:29-2443(+)
MADDAPSTGLHVNQNEVQASGLMRSVSVDVRAAEAPVADADGRADGLKRFQLAKEDIRKGLESIRRSFLQAAEFCEQPWVWSPATEKQRTLEVVSLTTLVRNGVEQCNEITKSIAREAMKVVFVGRTSNGKSTTINAMLRARVLPAGPGHTTNCFVTLRGADGDSAHVLLPDSGEKRTIKDVQSLSNALKAEHVLQPGQTLEIYWPRQQCHMLRDDVVILDSPGLDYDGDFDEWIDKTTRDADVFVLVVNAVSTLSGTEARFFQSVKRAVAQPNAFVLFNQWDSLDDEEADVQAVKAQHLSKARDLLVRDLDIVSSEDLDSRVFFVSSREALKQRLGSKSAPAVTRADMFHNTPATRADSFARFERTFELAITQHAIGTRFSRHVQAGRRMCLSLAEQLRGLLSHLDDELHRIEQHLNERTSALAALNNKQEKLENDCRAIVAHIPDKVYTQLLSRVQSEVVTQLPDILDRFDQFPFSVEHLDDYKSALTLHVEEHLQVELASACGSQVAEQYKTARKQLVAMTQQVLSTTNPLPPALIVGRPFEYNLGLDCRGLTEGFRPNLRFEFSWSWERLAPKFLPPAARHSIEFMAWDLRQRVGQAMEDAMSHSPMAGSPLPSEDKPRVAAAASVKEETALQRVGQMAVDVGRAGFEITTQTPYGFVLAACVPSAWRLLRFKWMRYTVLSMGAVVSGYYAYERLMYTSSAQELKFKSQFCDHAVTQLYSQARENTHANATFLRARLNEDFSNLIQEVGNIRSELERDIVASRQEKSSVQERLTDAKRLIADANTNKAELDRLARTYSLE